MNEKELKRSHVINSAIEGKCTVKSVNDKTIYSLKEIHKKEQKPK